MGKRKLVGNVQSYGIAKRKVFTNGKGTVAVYGKDGDKNRGQENERIGPRVWKGWI